MKSKEFAHLDPDLDRQSMARPVGWRPMFGQAGAAQSHLRNQKVGVGDLFLFFGWFREVMEDVLLRSASIGQEFVLQGEDYPKMVDWVSGLLTGMVHS